MRRVSIWMVLSIAAACGGKQQGSGNTSPQQVTLQISTTGAGVVSGAGPDCRGNCTIQLAKGSELHLTAVADAGAAFSGWGGACTGTAGCDLRLEGAANVSAAFGQAGAPPPPPPGSHLVTVTIEGSGRVVSDPAGLDCSAGSCSAPFTDGSNLALNATAAAGWTFAGFGSGCHGKACALTVAADTQVFAHFDPTPPQQATLTVTVDGPGQVSGNGLSCGNGGTTCQITVAMGTAISLTATAAAGARFTGWGDACNGTAGCTLTLSANAAVHAGFALEVQTLVAADGTSLAVIALNSTSVFYGRNLSDGGSVWSVAKTGGVPQRVASGGPSILVADDAFVYWASALGIFSAPVGGGAATPLVITDNLCAMSLDTDGALFWVEPATATATGAIHRMQNRVDRVIVANAPAACGLALDDTYVYYTTTAGGGTNGVVARARKDGTGTVTVLSGAVDAPLRLRADAKNVYVRATSGGVWAVSKADGTTTRLSTGNTDSASVNLADFDVNASVVYWNWVDGTSAPQGLFKANADGTGFAAVDSGQVFAPRVDDTAIFYWHNGALVRRLK
jgi:List-Bact-rpt repeat protein